MPTQDAFKVTNLDIIAAYRAAIKAEEDHRRAVIAYTSSLHPDAVAYAHGRYGHSLKVIGINPERDESHRYPPRFDDGPPPGWRWTESRSCYRPVQGKAGDAAREWLANMPKSPKPPIKILLGLTGLPEYVFTDHHMYWPGAFLDDEGVLWVTYGVRLDTRNEDNSPVTRLPDPLPEGVEHVRLSEFYAARERQEDRKTADV